MAFYIHMFILKDLWCSQLWSKKLLFTVNVMLKVT